MTKLLRHTKLNLVDVIIFFNVYLNMTIITLIKLL